VLAEITVREGLQALSPSRRVVVVEEIKRAMAGGGIPHPINYALSIIDRHRQEEKAGVKPKGKNVLPPPMDAQTILDRQRAEAEAMGDPSDDRDPKEALRGYFDKFGKAGEKGTKGAEEEKLPF